MKITTVVGARPQFIKVAAVSRAFGKFNSQNPNAAIHEVLVHTDQHYDDSMSGVFFRELELPAPKYHLGVGSGSHGYQTGESIKGVEQVLLRETPDMVLIYGDTNSTLAAAIAAAKLNVPIAHVEAGLRSFNRTMPEEVNRVVADHLATWHFCTSAIAAQNLADEGIRNGVHVVGDVMYDALLWQLPRAQVHDGLLQKLGVHSRQYALATIHRSENTNDSGRFQDLIASLAEIAERQMPVIMPIHPRTARLLKEQNISTAPVHLIDPASYEEMLCLESNARMILTDSGGVQKEAYWLGVPCVTLRDETEWTETVRSGWNAVVGADREKIRAAVQHFMSSANAAPRDAYGERGAADRIVNLLSRTCASNSCSSGMDVSTVETQRHAC